jgi:outer membrane immunogenic protein
MKKALIGIAALAALFAKPALAADLPLKAPPPPGWSWSGCYVGGQFGGSFGYLISQDVGNAAGVAYAPGGFAQQLFHNNPTGYFGGGQVGCNFQFGQYVLGLEGDIGEMHLSGSALDPGSANTRVGIGSGVYGDVAGRIGLAFGSSLMYIKAGGAEYNGRETFSTTAAGFVSNSNVGTFTGYTLGGGLEYHLVGNWTAKLEYLHYEFNAKGNNFNVTAAGGPFVFSAFLRIDTVKVGLNYKY